jgi:hypothetical protein
MIITEPSFPDLLWKSYDVNGDRRLRSASSISFQPPVLLSAEVSSAVDLAQLYAASMLSADNP